MSNPTMTSNGAREAGRTGPGMARPAAKRAPRPHTPGGVGLGKEAGREAQRLAAAILEVLAGVRTPGQAAEVLGVSLPRYYQVETRAMQALVAACVPRPRGPGRSPAKELTALRRQQERLERELSRQRTLVRLTQRTLGLAPPPAAAKALSGKDQKDKSKKRRRRPVVRALRAAQALQQRSQETASAEAASAAATSPDQERA
jgi:hypothetical protein